MDRRRGRTIPFFQKVRFHQLPAKHLSFLLLPGFAPAGGLFGPAPGAITLRKPFEGHQRERGPGQVSRLQHLRLQIHNFHNLRSHSSLCRSAHEHQPLLHQYQPHFPRANVEVIFAALMGGAGSVIGAVVGGTAFMTISNYLAVYLIRWEMFLGFALLVFVFWIRKGIWGYVRKV